MSLCNEFIVFLYHCLTPGHPPSHPYTPFIQQPKRWQVQKACSVDWFRPSPPWVMFAAVVVRGCWDRGLHRSSTHPSLLLGSKMNPPPLFPGLTVTTKMETQIASLLSRKSSPLQIALGICLFLSICSLTRLKMRAQASRSGKDVGGRAPLEGRVLCCCTDDTGDASPACKRNSVEQPRGLNHCSV